MVRDTQADKLTLEPFPLERRFNARITATNPPRARNPMEDPNDKPANLDNVPGLDLKDIPEHESTDAESAAPEPERRYQYTCPACGCVQEIKREDVKEIA